MSELQPIKASLVADLVGVINENLGALLHVRTVACSDCKGAGVAQGPEGHHDAVTCATCNGVGAVERYELDQAQLGLPRYGRLIEGYDFKQGQYVPKFRSKDKAFATLVKILGLDKAVIELSSAPTFAGSLSDEQRAAYVSQLKEMAQMGLLDGV